MRITDEMVEAAAKVTYKLETGLEDESWYRAYEVERELWRDQSRSVLEAALAVAPDDQKSVDIDNDVEQMSALIAEARAYWENNAGSGLRGPELVRRLADALEGATK